MIYKKVVEGIFQERPNRFIALVEIHGKVETCHVRNTGRCRELLLPGAKVYLEEAENPLRKTRYSLIGVNKHGLLINMDSQAPNQLVWEWIRKGNFAPEVILLKPETKYKNSRFDFYVETPEARHFIEVKGVTLEEDGITSFPDAPTARGRKHLWELVAAQEEGFCCHIFFVVQMEGATGFRPNRENDPQFAEALRAAVERGIDVKVLTCKVTPESVFIDGEIKNLQFE